VATDKQISFIKSLVDKHYLQGDEETAIMESIDGGITKQEAGDIIEKLKSLPLRSDMGEA
jgi:hypothetical protein